MPTIINNPSTDSSGEGMGMGVVIAIFAVVVLLLLYFGLPYMRSGTSTQPAGTGNSSSINVPDKIDVNVQKSNP